MHFPIIINCTSPFPILELLCDIFHFYSYFKRNFCKNSGEPDQKPRFAASDLVLHCISMSHKKNARFILVNINEGIGFL